jgi:hypothetical protein
MRQAWDNDARKSRHRWSSPRVKELRTRVSYSVTVTPEVRLASANDCDDWPFRGSQ